MAVEIVVIQLGRASDNQQYVQSSRRTEKCKQYAQAGLAVCHCGQWRDKQSYENAQNHSIQNEDEYLY